MDKKAFIITSDSRSNAVLPENGTDFSLGELNKIVGGHIEVVWIDDDHIMVLNEEGKLNGLPFNMAATLLYNNPNDYIVGDVLFCHKSMVK